MFFRRALWIFAAASCASCSVLENRDDCPCDLFLDFNHESCGVFDSLSVYVSSLHGSVTARRAEYASGLHIEVPRSECDTLAVYPSLLEPFINDGCFTLSAYSSCPQLYSFHLRFDAGGDSFRQEVTMHRNFCNVELCFVSDSPQAYVLELRSSFSGLAADGTPLPGLRRMHLAFDSTGRSRFRLLRQGDSSLMLEIISADGTHRNTALGAILSFGGYDWSAPDLEDISITIDYSSAKVTIECDEWTEEVFIPVTV